MGWDRHKLLWDGMGWDGTEKYVPWTSLQVCIRQLSNMAENKANDWNESEKKILKKHVKYYPDMLAYIPDLRRDGPTVSSPPSRKTCKKVTNNFQLVE